MKLPLPLCIFFFICLRLSGQITGIIIDKESGNGLPFASIGLKNKPIGTSANETGFFRVQYSNKQDTIVASFIGYETVEMALKDKGDSVVIGLNRIAFELNEILVYPLFPSEYIKRAMKKIPDNYQKKPFESRGWYQEKLTENDYFVQGEEAIFKTYYPAYQDTIKNQYQVLLHRKANDMRELEFMKKQRTKSFEKEKKKAEKRKDTNEVVMDGTNLENLFGGPDMILSIDLMKQREPFLDSNAFKQFEYSFANRSSYLGNELIVIHFKSKGTIEHMKLEGNVLIDSQSDAIVSIDYKGKYVIPLWLRPILFAMGLKVEKPLFEKKTLYEPYQGKWYPKKLHWNVNAKLTKQYWFSANEHSNFEIGQVFVITEIKTRGVSPIPEEKRFKAAKKMQDQVHAEKGVRWNDGKETMN